MNYHCDIRKKWFLFHEARYKMLPIKTQTHTLSQYFTDRKAGIKITQVETLLSS